MLGAVHDGYRADDRERWQLVRSTIAYDRAQKRLAYEPEQGVPDYSRFFDRQPTDLLSDSTTREVFVKKPGPFRFRKLRGYFGTRVCPPPDLSHLLGLEYRCYRSRQLEANALAA